MLLNTTIARLQAPTAAAGGIHFPVSCSLRLDGSSKAGPERSTAIPKHNFHSLTQFLARLGIACDRSQFFMSGVLALFR